MSSTVNSQRTPDADILDRIEQLGAARKRLTDEMGKVIVGQTEVIDFLLIGLLCRGHVLLHGVPGLGKTLMARTLSQTLDLEFKRVQFTPDLMPSDITGTDVLEPDGEGGHRMEFVPGPIFTNFLLADEINRTPPKTQASLLQAMQESEVSAGTQTYKLKPPFFVVATQNPIEMEGTYPLPEAQVDRFMFNVRVRYPSVAEEARIISGTTGTEMPEATAILGAEDLLALQDVVRSVPVADDVTLYAARLVAASRPGTPEAIDMVTKYVGYGASPRAGQSMVLAGKARAVLDGRMHVDFADLKAVAHPVLRHRLVLNFHARADGIDSDMVVDQLLQELSEEAS